MYSSLVTGGAGFIGSHIVQKLIQRGDRVRVIDNRSSGRIENLSEIHGSLEIIEGDIRDITKVNEVMKGIDYVFHQAAFVSVPKSMDEPQLCFDINVQGTLNILNAAKTMKVQRVVLASSTAVYGDVKEIPLVEETTPHPLSPYAASKETTEIYAGLYTRCWDVPVTVLRYFNVYGPRQSPYSDYAAAIPIFIRRLSEKKAPIIFGDGHQTRDFIFVDDVVRANLLAAEASLASGAVFNICTGNETSILELLEYLGELIPDVKASEYAPIRTGDIYQSYGNPEKAAQKLGFRAQVSLIEGLAITVAAMHDKQID
jgi:UDP-glucose 4-epimerase